MTEHTVAQAAKAAGHPGPVHFREVTGSTNADMVRLAEAGAPQWTLMVAGHQKTGRGRLGRSWVSSPGSSLLFSLLVRPSLSPSDAALVTLGAGACMAVACLVGCGVRALCKWPNDLVVDRRKLGGILVESSLRGDHLEYAVIGIGVNVTQREVDFPPELRDTATSISLEGGRPDAPSLLGAFLARFGEWWDPGAPHFPTTVLESYRQVCDTIGRTVRATTASGRPVEARAVAVGDSGELVLDLPTGREIVTFGDVLHVD